uniref:THAP-type domain-containing protein n=1 Tax=Oncorhynchus mykiss TaxID=8022 RepID=A0A8C7U1I8_ONCMY
MPGRCSAFNCRNTFKNVKHKTNKVTFHSFPKRDPKRIKEWVGQMKWKDWQPTPHSLLCSEHFEERCMDRTGQTVRLRDDAIPTIFAFPSHLQKKFQKTAGRRKRVTLFPEDPVPEESTQREKSPPTYLNHSIWHPSRFHDDYCVPQSIDWAVKDKPNEVPPSALQKQGLIFIPKLAIRIKEKWEWLTMEVKGPFPETQIGHRFVLTVMDYYSKWLEAYPMKTCTSKEIAQIISDLISRFGFPVGILCCLGVMLTVEINSALGDLKKLTGQLIFYHPLGVSLDPVTKSLVDRLVSDLVKEHPDRWDVYLAASVFSFCCKEHPTTRQIPLSLLRCGGTQSVSTSPRKLPYNGIKGRTFVILEAQPPTKEVCAQCSQCLEWMLVTQDSELKRYEEMKLGDEDHTHTCVSCRVAMSCRVALEVMRG